METGTHFFSSSGSLTPPLTALPFLLSVLPCSLEGLAELPRDLLLEAVMVNKVKLSI